MSVLTASNGTSAMARLPRWVNTALVAAIGVALASVTMKLLPSEVTIPAAAPVQATSGNTAVTDLREQGRRIAALHVFGNAAEKPVVDDKPKPVAPPKETALNLQLAGVFAADPQSSAIAIISSGSAEQNAYGVGDKITGEVTLSAVYPDYVVIDNRGKEEIVKMLESSQPIAMSSISAAASNSAPVQDTSNELDESQPLELPTNPGELRDTLARNPSMLGRVVAAEPYQENGKLVGYRITPKQNPEILEAQGIIAGDVITRVNNIQLNSQKQGIRALRNAVKADNLEVTVLRDGVEVPLSISLVQ